MRSVKTFVSKYGSQQCNQQRTSLLVFGGGPGDVARGVFAAGRTEGIDGNGEIGGQVLVFVSAAAKHHRSMGKQRRDFSFSHGQRSFHL